MTAAKRILFATDLSPASRPAFDEALRVAQGGADLILAHAYAVPNLGEPLALAPHAYDEIDHKLRQDAERRLDVLVAEARRRGIDARAIVILGDPYEAISRTAKDEGVDLVVMGTHGRTGVARFFVGSVASRVIATSPCPVLTVRAA